MTDIHTHILPGVDDGSASIEESAKMLKIMQEDGVKTAVATPHFRNEISVDEFLEKRRVAFCKLESAGLTSGVSVRLGAEVALEYGLHEVSGLDKLAFCESGYMLVEPPYAKWDSWVYDELFKIGAKCGVDIIIAHAERFMRFNSIDAIARLKDMDFKIQVNGDNFGSFFVKSDSIKLMRAGLVDFVASDCHNTDTRKPILGEAYCKLRSKMGADYVKRLKLNAELLFGTK